MRIAQSQLASASEAPFMTALLAMPGALQQLRPAWHRGVAGLLEMAGLLQMAGLSLRTCWIGASLRRLQFWRLQMRRRLSSSQQGLSAAACVLMQEL